MFIKAENISKSYSNHNGNAAIDVLKDLCFEIEKGSKVAIMGPSGSGKTTLLNIIGTLQKPDSGILSLDNKQINNLADSEILRLRNQHIGFVFQFHNLLPQCTLLENVLLPTLAFKNNQAEVEKRAVELLKYLNIYERKDNKPGELSGGECQRAAVARALINNPGLILADEPTGSLDKKNAEILTGILNDISKSFNVTLVVATHSESVSKKMDRVIYLEDGKIKSY